MHTQKKRYGMVGLGLGLSLGLVWGTAGCGIGTEPSLLSGRDGTVAPALDAAPGTGDADASSLAGTTPPIDQRTYGSTATATFALG